MTSNEYAIGDLVTAHGPRGKVIHGVVTDLIPAEVYGQPCAIVEMHDGPMAGSEKRFAEKDLTRT